MLSIEKGLYIEQVEIDNHRDKINMALIKNDVERIIMHKMWKNSCNYYHFHFLF